MKKRKIIILIVSLLSLLLVASITHFLVVELPKIIEKEKRQKEFDEYYAKTLIEYDEENKLYEDYEVDVAFLGDSLTAGYDVKSYYPEYLVTNRGIGGETTHGLLKRLAVSVLELKPKVCVLLIGGNNPDTMFEDYEDILISFKENLPNTEIIVVSHAPTSGPDWGKRNVTFAYNNVKIKLLAEKYNYEFVDVYSLMLDLETGEMKAEYTTDGAHFTQKGYKVYTNTLKPVIDELLK